MIIYLTFVAAKSGIDPSGCVELAKHVKLRCPNLIFSGLMTIGMKDYSSTPKNFKVQIPTKPKGKLYRTAIRPAILKGAQY